MRDQPTPGNAGRVACSHIPDRPPSYRSTNLATDRNALHRIQDRRSGARNLPGPKAGDGRRPRKATRRSGMDRIHRMSRGRKTLLSLLLVGALGAVAGIGTFSAFSATTVERPATTSTPGRSSISDNDAEAAMYNITDCEARRRGRAVHPGDVHRIARLDRVAVRARPSDAIGQFVDLTIDKGTGTGVRSRTAPASRLRPTCSRGTLGELRRGAHELRQRIGRPLRGAQTQWNTNNTLVYRFTLDAPERRRPQSARRRATHSFTWEAQNV